MIRWSGGLCRHLYVVDHCQDLVDVRHLLSHQLLQLLRLAVKPEMSDTVQQKARRPISEEEMCFCSTVHVSFAFYQSDKWLIARVSEMRREHNNELELTMTNTPPQSSDHNVNGVWIQLLDWTHCFHNARFCKSLPSFAAACTKGKRVQEIPCHCQDSPEIATKLAEVTGWFSRWQHLRRHRCV